MDSTVTYCGNCGSINCSVHVEIERLEETPVCTGCAGTEQFVLSQKYVWENLETFRERYEAIPVYEKPLENTPLTAAVVFGLVGTVPFALTSVGVL